VLLAAHQPGLFHFQMNCLAVGGLDLVLDNLSPQTGGSDQHEE
jgi:hypothetical protein